jgi:hypothetical protein
MHRPPISLCCTPPPICTLRVCMTWKCSVSRRSVLPSTCCACVSNAGRENAYQERTGALLTSDFFFWAWLGWAVVDMDITAVSCYRTSKCVLNFEYVVRYLESRYTEGIRIFVRTSVRKILLYWVSFVEACCRWAGPAG